MTQTLDTGQPADATASLLRVVEEVASELHPHSTMRATLDSQLDRELRFDSLGRVELLARLERIFGCALPEQVAAAVETPRDLLRALLAAHPIPGGDADIDTGTPASAEASVPIHALTLPEVLAWHAGHEPDRCHIRFYADEGDEKILTFVAAAEAGLAIVPVAIRGTRSILRADSWFPRRGAITIVAGAAIHPEVGDHWTAAGVLRDEVRRHILRHCGEPDLAVH